MSVLGPYIKVNDFCLSAWISLTASSRTYYILLNNNGIFLQFTKLTTRETKTDRDINWPYSPGFCSILLVLLLGVSHTQSLHGLS